MVRWNSVSLVVLLLIVLGVLPLSEIRGQTQNLVNVFVPADRTLRQHLVRAAKAIEEERFSDAVTELGHLLANSSDGANANAEEPPQDFFLDASPTSANHTSLKSEAQRLLGTLPPKGRELYELQFGATARALLDQAIRKSSLETLHEVTRRYFHTKAGGEATLLLGRLYLDAGRPLAAALFLKQLADLPAIANDFEPELSVLLAACWYRAHQPEKAQQTLQALVARQGAAVLQIGTGQAERLPNANETLAWLEEHFGGAQQRSEQKSQWSLFRGNESRNAESRGGHPLESFRWQVRVAGFEHDQRLIEEIQQTYVEQGLPMITGLQPLAIGNVVLMRTPEQLLAIDFETGKRVWNYPWWDMPQVDEGPETFGQTAATERDMRKHMLTQRLWNDAPYGQVSSDGEFVFLLDNLPQIAPIAPQRLRFQFRGNMGFPNGDFAAPSNQLVALELKREGALKWKVGGETGLEEPQLAGAFFLGPPLPLFGNLYVLAEMRGEVRLVVLDAETGRQQWSQQLAHLEGVMTFDTGLRRLAGATPSFADGVLVCPTSSGAVVGVDVATRRLLWGYQYPQATLPANMGIPFSGSFQSPTGRWIDATATISEGCVVLTPPESDLLICLDLLTGQPRWKPIEREGNLADMLFIGCIHEGKIVLAGKDRMVALNLSDGQSAWHDPLLLDESKGEMPSGRGFKTGSSYFLPTTAAQLLEVDLRDGKVKSRTRTDSVLGNLICFKDDVISLAANRATTSYQLEPLRERVAQRLAKDDRDAWALARQGELFLHDGKHAEALAALQRANEVAPNDVGVRSLLVATYLTALRQDFVRHQGLAEKIEPLIENEDQRIDYLLMLGDGSKQAGKLDVAAEAFAKLARLAFNSFGNDSGNAFPVVSPVPGWNVRLDRYVLARLTELYQVHDAKVDKTLDQLIQELSTTAAELSVADVSRFFQLCGFHPSTDELRLKHVAKLIDEGKALEADWELKVLESRQRPTIGGTIAALRARIYVRTNHLSAIAASYEQLRQRWPNDPVLDGKTGQQLYDEAATKGLTRAMAMSDRWPWGKTEVHEASDAFGRNGFPRKMSIPIGAHSADRQGLRLVFDMSMNAVYVRDRGGDRIVNLSQNDGSVAYTPAVAKAELDGQMLFVNLGGQLVAVSLLQNRAASDETILWKENLLPLPTEVGSHIPRPMPRQQLIPFDPQPKSVSNFEDSLNRPVAQTGPMTRSGVVYQKIRTLTCADALTGKTQWSRQSMDQGMELFGDAQFVFAIPRGDREAILIDAMDGREIGKRTLPPADRRWTTCGRNVLAWETREDGFRLFLLDAEQQKDVWSLDLPQSSRGYLIDNDALAIIEPGGKFQIRSLENDRVLIESSLAVPTPIESIRVRLSEDDCLVFVNETETSPENPRFNPAMSNVLMPVNGLIYSFDRQDGSPKWQSPVSMRGYLMPVEQPDDLPTLWFMRQSKEGKGPAQNNRTDVLCLDRRSGSVLYERKTTPTQITSSIEVIPDSKKREISLILPQTALAIQFTDAPRPPEPPAQLDP